MVGASTNGQLDAVPRRVAILVNPLAGTGPSGDIVAELVQALRRRHFEPVICVHREELSERVAQEGNTFRCVVAAGGDGTLAEVLNRAPGLPVAILPLGNENLVASFFHLAPYGQFLADNIAGGHLAHIDLARANGRVFALVASAGIDADVVHRVHRQRRGHINRLTWVSPALHALAMYRYPLIEVEILETGEKLAGTLALVFNLPRYAAHVPVAPQARADDGLLDLCVFERGGVRNLARYLYGLLRGRHARIPGFHHRLVQRVRLDSPNRPVPFQIDGDPAGRLPMQIDVLPGALKLIVPPARRAGWDALQQAARRQGESS